jgi:hypothetical protein
MSTSTKSPNTIRQGGPGASHENAKAPLDIKKGQPDHPQREHGKVSGGGGEHDSHHSHEPGRKGGGRKH